VKYPSCRPPVNTLPSRHWAVRRRALQIRRERPGGARLRCPGSTAVVNITATDPNASEAGDQGEFTFTRGGGNTSASLRVFFDRGGAAASNVDYTSVGGFPNYIDFPANELTVIQAVVTIDDALDEPAESVILTLSTVGNPPQYTIGASGAALCGLGRGRRDPGLWLPRYERRMRRETGVPGRGADSALELRQYLFEHLLRVADQHPVVLHVEQRIVDARVARGH